MVLRDTAQAMSEENVEVVRRGFEAWNRQDLEAVRECFPPDLEIDASDRVLNPDIYQGVEGFMRMRSEIGEAWDEKVTRARLYRDRAQALEAAGLSE
jgi:ketosteroid isomerase-like protein